MSTAIYRPDYAKFLFHTHEATWSVYYRRFIEMGQIVKYAGDFLKSHKVTRLWYNKDNGMETWSLEVWGEWAGIVTTLPAEWLKYLKRFDVRAVLWDANEDAIIEVGQHLQRTVTSTNINCYSTKKRSKRGGRDTGGTGFAIGSHKSDLRITSYKRNGEPCAQEYQCAGDMLRKAADEALELWYRTGGTTDPWFSLSQNVQQRGEERLARIFQGAGMGVHWPTFARDGEYAPPLPPSRYEPTPADLAEMDQYMQGQFSLENELPPTE